MDAVMMLTGDTEHRELLAFERGILAAVPETFVIPYVHVINEPGRDRYWAFLRDVRPEVEALGMHTKVSEETVQTILAHLAAFHAKFWEDHSIIDQPWLMSLRRPVDYFYRCITDILDGMSGAAESSVYICEKWPWLAEGVPNLMESLGPETRRTMEGLYREPHRLLERIEPMPKTLCHYDFDNRNLGIDTSSGETRTIVLDWEILGNGISSSDVVRFMVYQQPEHREVLIEGYLDELERQLGSRIDRDGWKVGYDLAAIAEWQIRGVLFGIMVQAPSAPVPDDQRDAMREHVFADIGYVESLVRKHGLG
jgi:hypothetical protein